MDKEKRGDPKFRDKRMPLQTIEPLNSDNEVSWDKDAKRSEVWQGKRPATSNQFRDNLFIPGIDSAELLTDSLDERIETERPRASQAMVFASPEKLPSNPLPNLVSSIHNAPGLNSVVQTLPGVLSNPARIKVVVRKRPLNKKELHRRERDVVQVDDPMTLVVHEQKYKFDLTPYEIPHKFRFDAVLNETATNYEVYRETVQPLVPTIFQRAKATCFTFGQTGSGKTYTMESLPLKAAQDMLNIIALKRNEGSDFQLWIGYFEIYGGKLFDLLNDRAVLPIREDGKKQVCIVNLTEKEVVSVDTVNKVIALGTSARRTGKTGANEESSRSHAILRMVIRQTIQPDKTQMRRPGRLTGAADSEKDTKGKIVGKLSFIDLAGSERGADTTNTDLQTREEGKEINKSLFALKECIRALDKKQDHIPFRGSKLTEVLRDSFVGNSRTVMVSCISPGSASVEHTLNTLLYADQVKSLSRSSNDDTGASIIPPVMAAPTGPIPTGWVEQQAAISFPARFGEGTSSATVQRPSSDNPLESNEALQPNAAAASDHGHSNARSRVMGAEMGAERGSFKENKASKLAEDIVDEVEVDNGSAEVLGTLPDELEGGLGFMKTRRGGRVALVAFGIPPETPMEVPAMTPSAPPPSAVKAADYAQAIPEELQYNSVVLGGLASKTGAEAAGSRPSCSMPATASEDLANVEAAKKVTVRRKQPSRKAKPCGKRQKQEDPSASCEVIEVAAPEPAGVTSRQSTEMEGIVSRHDELISKVSTWERQAKKAVKQMHAGKGSYDAYLIETSSSIAGLIAELAPFQAEISMEIARRYQDGGIRQ